MKILVFAGTKNGRLLVESLANHHHIVYASSISHHGANLINIHDNITCLVGKMTTADIVAFVKSMEIELIIDSTHPYAKEISLNIMEASQELQVDVIRFERESSISSCEGIHFNDFQSALNYLKDLKGNILFTTGVNEVLRMVNTLDRSRIFVRIVPMKSSIDKANEAGMLKNHVIQKTPPYTLEENINHINDNHIKYLVTKDSGQEGNTKEKIVACQQLCCQLLVIDRPKIDYSTILFTTKEILYAINHRK